MFKLLNIFTLCIFLLLFSCKKNSQENNILSNKENKSNIEEIKKAPAYGVINEDRIRFRDDKDLHSKTLRYLDKGEIVTILEKDINRVKIGEMEDCWYKVEFQGIKGWVYGYFLDTYSALNEAEEGSKKYIQLKSSSDKDKNFYYEDAINKNLFFLSNGKILQVIDGKQGIANKLKTKDNFYIVEYYFTNSPNLIYYVAKSFDNINGNGFLYSYNLQTENNQLIYKSVYSAYINDKSKNALIVKLYKDSNEKSWIINSFNLETFGDNLRVAQIKINKEYKFNEKDTFTMTLKREFGSLVNLKWADSANFIYFKPPEENQTYLISISKGDYIQVDIDKSNSYEIDSSMFIKINSEEDKDGTIVYSIVLNDKFSGIQKELVKSKLYPINFAISPKKNFLAITMVDVNNLMDIYYKSSIYVLSLYSYSLIDISTEGNSYQPKWSNILLN